MAFIYLTDFVSIFQPLYSPRKLFRRGRRFLSGERGVRRARSSDRGIHCGRIGGRVRIYGGRHGVLVSVRDEAEKAIHQDAARPTGAGHDYMSYCCSYKNN